MSKNEYNAQESNKARIRARQREYYQANKEAVKAKTKAYYEENRDEALAKMRAYHEANREEINARTRERRRENRELVNARKTEHRSQSIVTYRERERSWQLKAKYGLTFDQFRDMLADQRGRCKCCKTAFGLLPKQGPRVDHCHATGKIRGIICNRCNLLLGLAEDSAKVLRNCARYLS